MGFLPQIFDSLLSLILSLYLSLSLSLPLSLSLSLSTLSLSHLSPSLYFILIKKIKGPQSLLQIGGDRGSIETVNLAVSEDVS